MMCCTTKRKIADCVRQLVREKEIRRITVQDIMNRTNMSRQSFYYHFQDIYDVLKWIGRHDFAETGICPKTERIEVWILQLVHTICADRAFYGRIVREIHWPELFAFLRRLIVPSAVLICRSNEKYLVNDSLDWQTGMDVFAASVSCYLLEYIYYNRQIQDGQVLRELRYVTAVLEDTMIIREPSKNRTDSTKPLQTIELLYQT